LTTKAKPILTQPDQRRLGQMTRSLREQRGPHSGFAGQLARRMAAAEVTPARGVDPDVVTMNSRVRLKDIDTGACHTFKLVFQRDAGGLDESISVLSPLGCALLGTRVGDVIDWRVRFGVRRMRIDSVPYQPEAAGDFDL